MTRRYYIVRSIVRTIFWGTVLTGTALAAGAIASAGEKPECPITFNINFTYTAEPYNPAECDLPPNMSIDGNGHWYWTN